MNILKEFPEMNEEEVIRFLQGELIEIDSQIEAEVKAEPKEKTGIGLKEWLKTLK